MRVPSRRSFRRLLVACLAISVANGCGSGDPVDTEDPTITLSLSPTAATVEQGGSVVVTGTATAGGSFSGTASVTVQGVPTGVTGTVGAPQTSGATTTVAVTLDVGASVAPGVYPITVRASGSGVSADATFTLTVEAAGTLEIDVAPDALTLEQGTAGSAEIDVTRTDFTGVVDLSTEGAPTGMTVAFDPASPTGDASVITVTVGGEVAADTYDLVIRGEATGTDVPDATTELTVTVTEVTGPAYSISLDPDALMLDQAQPQGFVQGDGPARVNVGTISVAVARVNGHTATVALSLIEAPAGVTGVFSPAEVTGDASELTVTVGQSVEPGEYDLFVRGTDESLDPRLAQLSLVVSPAPGYELGLDPDGLSLEQGEAGDVSVTLERVNFEGEITLTLDGEPAGVTGTFGGNPVTGEASTLTLSVSEAVAPGGYDLTVRGEASGLTNRTAALTLTVTEASGFSLASVADLTIQQGSSGMRTVTIEREGGFDASVTVSVTPEVSGLTIALDPTSTTGNSVTLTATASMSLAPQTYLFEISGNSAGEPEATTGLDINVTAASGSDVSLDYSQCSVDEQPVWVSYKDGSSDWAQATGVGAVYEFDVSESMVGLAVVTTPTLGSSELDIVFMTATQLMNGVYDPDCDDALQTKQVNYTASGLAMGETGSLYMGGGLSFLAANGAGIIGNVGLGSYDAVGFVQNLMTPGSERVFLRRDQDVTDLGAIDLSLSSSEVVAAATGTITVGGLGAGEEYSGGVIFNTSTTAGMCLPATLHFLDVSMSSTFTAYGVPGGSMDDGDAHSISLVVADGLTSTRSVTEDFETMGNRTVALPMEIPVPTITTPTAPYKILHASLTMPGEYDTSSLEYDANGKDVSLRATAEYLGGGAQALEVPDFTSVSGWNSLWAPAPTDEVSWTVTGIGGIFTERCVDGARFVLASRTGTQN